jgi:5-enolpyruvylshikimate-3-phosphate synthase
MAGTTLDQLPQAVALSGSELVWLYQQGPNDQTPWIGVSCTTFQIAALINGNSGTSVCSMRQLVAALAANGVLVAVAQAVPGDITTSTNIAWNHAYRMTISDSFVTGFLQPTLGYTNAQMIALFVEAQSFPV